MSIDELESSVDSAEPRELFLFTQGTAEWAFSGADESVEYLARTFVKEAIVLGEVDQSQEDNSSHAQIRLPTRNPVAVQFIGIQPTLPIYVTVYRVHRSGAAGVRFVGRVIQGTANGPETELECAPLKGALSRQIPSWLYQRECNHALYDLPCGVDRELFKVTANIDSVGGFTITATEFGSQADGWFRYGYVEVVTGLSAGDRRAILDHAGTQLTLQAPFRALVPGDTVHAFAGCDRTESMCRVKFNNLANHLGFARIPDRNPHDGRMGS